ncbi:hypothetical protein DFJ67_5481 [Asanoa ferruginea]|uniref:Uncharacterized protein n=1 Tax=Asanoa ferruginea TaxID=53367 RepID=A0A3D9ZQC7_9ACTN|nr:hypothetical protein DFJ67_5481 [Asanoa ferruginea]
MARHAVGRDRAAGPGGGECRRGRRRDQPTPSPAQPGWLRGHGAARHRRPRGREVTHLPRHPPLGICLQRADQKDPVKLPP